MKTLFLDFDGVINNEIMYNAGYNNKFKDRPYPISAFDFNCIEKVNRILKETGAKMVITSSWRIDGFEILQNLCVSIGLPTDFDRTPILMDKRGKEIKLYLERHPEVDRYAIVDDDDDMLEEQQEHFVRCNGYYGITEENVNRIIEKLNL